MDLAPGLTYPDLDFPELTEPHHWRPVVAISEKLRASIFRKLSPVIGEEETEAVLSNFPSRDVEEPVTKEHLQLELTLIRTDLDAGLAAVRSDLTTGLAAARLEIAGVRTAVADFKAEIHQTLNRMFVALVTIQLAIAGVTLTIAKS